MQNARIYLNDLIIGKNKLKPNSKEEAEFLEEIEATKWTIKEINFELLNNRTFGALPQINTRIKLNRILYGKFGWNFIYRTAYITWINPFWSHNWNWIVQTVDTNEGGKNWSNWSTFTEPNPKTLSPSTEVDNESWGILTGKKWLLRLTSTQISDTLQPQTLTAQDDPKKWGNIYRLSELEIIFHYKYKSLQQKLNTLNLSIADSYMKLIIFQGDEKIKLLKGMRHLIELRKQTIEEISLHFKSKNRAWETSESKKWYKETLDEPLTPMTDAAKYEKFLIERTMSPELMEQSEPEREPEITKIDDTLRFWFKKMKKEFIWDTYIAPNINIDSNKPWSLTFTFSKLAKESENIMLKYDDLSMRISRFLGNNLNRIDNPWQYIAEFIKELTWIENRIQENLSASGNEDIELIKIRQAIESSLSTLRNKLLLIEKNHIFVQENISAFMQKFVSNSRKKLISYLFGPSQSQFNNEFVIVFENIQQHLKKDRLETMNIIRDKWLFDSDIKEKFESFCTWLLASDRTEYRYTPRPRVG